MSRDEHPAALGVLIFISALYGSMLF